MHHDNKTKAVCFMLMSAFAFAIMHAFVKLAGEIPVAEKVFFRNSVSLLVAVVAIGMSPGTRLFGKKESHKYLLLRSMMGLAGVALNFYAISHLKLADSSMLNKLSPFFVTLFACLFLKEKLSRLQIPALLVVFVSALFIIKPSFDMTVLPALCGALSAVCAGAAYTIIRFLKGREEPATIVFYFSFASVVGSLPFMIMSFKQPTPMQFFYLIMIGVSASFGQFGVTLAYKYAKASEISLYNYTNILFAGIVGYFIWGSSEIPDRYSIIGGAGIIATASAMFFYNRRAVRS